MESSGIYWRPVFNLLEEGRTIILVNAQHMKAVAFPQDRCEGRRVDRRTVRGMACGIRQFHSP